MYSRRNSFSTTQGSTVVQSPGTCASSCFNLNPSLLSPPTTPVLDVHMDGRPFSEAFSGVRIMQSASDEGVEAITMLSSLTEATIVHQSQGASLQADESFHIERITDMKTIDPQWEDNEIEEILVISPKHKPSSSFLNLHDSFRLTIPGFDAFQPLRKEPHADILLARSCSESRTCLVKMVRRTVTSEPSMLNRVRSEQACLKAVTERNAPFLPVLKRSFYDAHHLYIITDNYPGGGLLEFISSKEQKHLPAKQCQFYASEIVEALAFLHSIKIIHRNVNLASVMIDSDGHIVLCDFSAAKLLLSEDSPKCSATSICGSPDYQAPEQMLGWHYDFSVDCWAFGILLCLMQYGQHPFETHCAEMDPLILMQRKILHGEPPSHPSQRTPFLEWDLIKKCLEPNPRLRLTMSQVKAHPYFSEIDWIRVKHKNYDAPHTPDMNTGFAAPLGKNLDEIHERNFLDLKRSPTCDLDDEQLDGFCFVQSSTTYNSQLMEAIQGTVSNTLRSSMTSGEVDEHAKAGILRTFLSTKSTEQAEQVRSILKSPSHYFPGDSIPVAGFPDLRRSASRGTLASATDKRRKLRKKRSSMAPTTPRASTLIHRKSISSLLGIARQTDDWPNTPSQRSPKRSSVSSALVDLPAGVVQSGRGIGYTHTPQASRSKLSLVSVKSNSCFGKLGLPFRIRTGKSTDSLPRTQQDVMQQIYGSNWSVGRMSTVTFGIPEGLGRRVDDEDLPPMPAI